MFIDHTHAHTSSLSLQRSFQTLLALMLEAPSLPALACMRRELRNCCRFSDELTSEGEELVDEMMTEGLLGEAEQFYQYRQMNTLNTVGYKELYEYMAGNWSLDFAVNMIKQDSRRYAKRQLTWFNRDKEIQWFEPTNEDEVIEFINNKITSK